MSSGHLILVLVVLVVFTSVQAHPLVGLCERNQECKHYKECKKERLLVEKRIFDQTRFCGVMITDDLICCEKLAILALPETQKTKVLVSASTIATLSANTTKLIKPIIVNDVITLTTHRNSYLINNPTICGVSMSNRVKGGEVADLNQFPWLVILKYKSNDGETETFNCGGSLISNRYVLTAAHCRSTELISLFSVRLGEHAILINPDCIKVQSKSHCNPPFEDIEIESFVAHEDYDSNSKLNDIALIRLARSVTLSKEIKHIKTICLPVESFHQIEYKEADFNAYDGFEKEVKKLVVAGWGQTEVNASFSDVPRFAYLDYESNVDCISNLNEKKKDYMYQHIRSDIKDTQMCAGGSVAADACKGDSGSALMGHAKLVANKPGERTFLYGIVSLGIDCKANATMPGIFTRVSTYMNWIMNHMSN